MKTTNFTEQEILNIIGNYHSVASMVHEFRKNPIPFCDGDEREKQLKGLEQQITNIAKDYANRTNQRDKLAKAVEILYLNSKKPSATDEEREHLHDAYCVMDELGLIKKEGKHESDC